MHDRPRTRSNEVPDRTREESDPAVSSLRTALTIGIARAFPCPFTGGLSSI